MKSRDQKSQSKSDLGQFEAAAALFDADPASTIEKIEAFPKFVSRQAMAKFITKYEIFKQILEVNGSIVECGVLHGGGTLAWAKMSSIFEPANHLRKVIGFDTFGGFPSVTAEDTRTGSFHELRQGGLTGSPCDNVLKAIQVYDINRPINHIPKVELVQGDIATSGEAYLKANPHLVVALLYLDFDLYEPTKKAIDRCRLCRRHRPRVQANFRVAAADWAGRLRRRPNAPELEVGPSAIYRCVSSLRTSGPSQSMRS
jgi:hypothetical protein